MTPCSGRATGLRWRRPSRVGIAIAVLGCLAIALVTLTPLPPSNIPLGSAFFDLPSFDDVLRNIVLFLPLGFGLRLAGVSARRAFLLVLATTIAIEALQYEVIPGRDGNLGDIVDNTLGGTIGIWLAAFLPAYAFPFPAVARRLALATAVVWLAVVAGTGIALQWSPPDRPLVAMLAPRDEGYDWFRGTLLAASIAGLPLDSAHLPVSSTLHGLLARDVLALSARIIPGRALEEKSTIVSVVGDGGVQYVDLGQNADLYMFSHRVRAEAIGLRSPVLALRAPGEGGTLADTLELDGARAGRTMSLRVRSRLGERTASVTIGPGLGWSLISPIGYLPDPWYRVGSALWVAALLFPLGYWGARAAPARSASRAPYAMPWSLLVIAAIGLGSAPLWGLAPPHWSEGVAAAAAVLVGWQLGRQSRRVQETSWADHESHPHRVAV